MTLSAMKVIKNTNFLITTDLKQKTLQSVNDQQRSLKHCNKNWQEAEAPGCYATKRQMLKHRRQLHKTTLKTNIKSNHIFDKLSTTKI